MWALVIAIKEIIKSFYKSPLYFLLSHINQKEHKLPNKLTTITQSAESDLFWLRSFEDSYLLAGFSFPIIPRNALCMPLYPFSNKMAH